MNKPRWSKALLAGRVRGLFLDNVVAKLMALAMALALWLYAYNFSIVRERAFTLPVRIRAANGWSVVPVEPPLVEVKLDFPRRFEEDMKQDVAAGKLHITCRVLPDETGKDLQLQAIKFDRSEHLNELRAYSIRKASFLPRSLEIAMVRQDTLEVPVLLRYTTPPEGYVVEGEPSVMPAKVKVRGRKDILVKAAGIETELVEFPKTLPVTVAEWPCSGSVGLKQRVIVDNRPYAVVCSEKIDYVIKLNHPASTRKFPATPINLSAPVNYPYEVEFLGERTRNVVVTGPGKVMSALKGENIVLYVRPPNPKPDELPYTVPLTIETDFVNTFGASALRVILTPPTIDVKIKKRQSE